MPNRTVVWVSAGTASAVAAKLVLAQGPAVLAYTDTGAEDADNARFLDDLEGWFGQEILRLRSSKYRDLDDLLDRATFIVGPQGAPCTRELKRRVRFSFQQPEDRQVFGYTDDPKERERARNAEMNDPGIDWWWPLIEAGLTKDDCLAMVERAGLTLPRTYGMGYPHANCIGCVKANNFTYWNMVRVDFPDVFARRARQERRIGHSICSEEVTAGSRAKTPVWLDELDPERGKGRPVPKFECSLACASAEMAMIGGEVADE